MYMLLRDWRKKRGLSQTECAARLKEHADKIYPDDKRDLSQTTLGYWERGTMPRKFWLTAIQDFTNQRVTADDFL